MCNCENVKFEDINYRMKTGKFTGYPLPRHDKCGRMITGEQAEKILKQLWWIKNENNN